MAWLIQLAIRASGGSEQLQYLWCDWPRAQRYYSYASAIGYRTWGPRGSFVSSWRNNRRETWFDQDWFGRDPAEPTYWEAPGSEGRGTVITYTPAHYILVLYGLEHTNPNVPRMGQTGGGELLQTNYPVADEHCRWTTMARYPGA